jgi:carbonic anhydrase
MNAARALKRLIDGNERYVTERYAVIDVGLERREELAEGQHPFAVIVGCTDSRVPPEIVFDQGLGNLFVVRTAGEVVDDVVLGSVEYAIEHLGVRLIVVLGHEACGAVKAAVEGGYQPGHISVIIEAIEPAVEVAKTQKGDLLYNAIKANIDLNIYKLQSSSRILREAMRNKGLTIIGAMYDIHDGSVGFNCRYLDCSASVQK